MGKIISGIPYKSQYDSDAGKFRNDCGPACVSMILNGLGKNVSTNAVYHRTGASANGYVSVSQMIRAAYTYKVKFEYFYPWSMNELKLAVKAGTAPITLIHYGAWSRLGKTQNKFAGPHFVVVVGFDKKYIYVNDPLWKDPRREEGEHLRWTYEEFLDAWSSASKDGNRNYSGIYCTHPLTVENFKAGGEPEEPPPPPEPPTEETPPPPPPFEIDPALKRRILAWAAYYDIPLKELDSRAAVTAYTDAMGDWGLRTAIHEVESDDTFPLISLKYYDSPSQWEVLVHFNGLSFSDPLHDGDQIVVPEPLERPVVIPPEEIPMGGTSLHDKTMVESGGKPTPQVLNDQKISM